MTTTKRTKETLVQRSARLKAAVKDHKLFPQLVELCVRHGQAVANNESTGVWKMRDQLIEAIGQEISDDVCKARADRVIISGKDEGGLWGEMDIRDLADGLAQHFPDGF